MSGTLSRFLKRVGSLLVTAAALSTAARAHDTWVEASSRLVAVGDVVHVELFLGNHGNDHRDFKVAGKLASLEGASLDVIGPDGKRIDLVPDAVDMGYAPKEGFWAARFVPSAPGLHCVAHTRTGVHGRKRGIKSGKTFFVASDKLDEPPSGGVPHAEALGHALELVPSLHPVLQKGPGRPLTVRLLFHGKPLAGHRVSFVPRGMVLSEGLDPEFERMTDAEGRCSFEPREGNLVLVVAHLEKPDETGAEYDRTVYSATLVFDVPERCPCCD